MKKISAEEANSTQLLNNGREIAVTAGLKQLKPGEGLTVSKNEWKAKYPPSRIARRLEKKLGWKFRTGRLLDNSGWLLHRIS